MIEIVVIEDEEDILELIEYHLTKEGYRVTGFVSTVNVERFLEEERPQLMLIDRNLPIVEGSEFVRYLRRLGYDIPVIFLTAKDKEEEIEEGFEAGCDDYIRKPFSPNELKLRIKALLKRSGLLPKETKLRYKKLILDLDQKALTLQERNIALTHLEFHLLLTFMQHPNQILSRDFLRERVWGAEKEPINDNAINVAITRLKSKIDPQNREKYFHSIWGVGYNFY